MQNYLEENLGAKVISVGSPRDRLERFFLRKVQQAQTEMVTSGALAGGKVSDFLMAKPQDQGRDLLNKLASAQEPIAAPAAVPAPIEPSPTAVEREVLDQLISRDAERLAQEPMNDIEANEPTAALPEQEKVDRDLLDDLINRTDKKDPKNGNGG